MFGDGGEMYEFVDCDGLGLFVGDCFGILGTKLVSSRSAKAREKKNEFQ